jgi:hypothetical protein
VQIRYFLLGPFGGYGGYKDSLPDLKSYEIQASANGTAAKEVMIVVYARDCKFQTYDLSLLEDSHPKQIFVCDPLGTVRLSGEIAQAELVQDGKAEVEISYLAPWANHFFGILDGFMTEFEIGTAAVSSSGHFEIALPDFNTDTAIPSSDEAASLQLSLYKTETGNVIARDLKPQPEDLRSEPWGLRIMASYPRGLIFSATQE